MANENAKSAEAVELTVEDKLKYIFDLQRFHSEIDKIKTLRGELPLEVQDLEDEIAGLETRINKLKDEVKEFEQNVTSKKNEITEAQALIKKYQDQQSNVRNNREYDSLSQIHIPECLVFKVGNDQLYETSDTLAMKVFAAI